jgi:hypothetical protein
VKLGIEPIPYKIGEIFPRKLNLRNFSEAIFFHANLSLQFVRVRKLQDCKVRGQTLVWFLEILGNSRVAPFQIH